MRQAHAAQRAMGVALLIAAIVGIAGPALADSKGHMVVSKDRGCPHRSGIAQGGQEIKVTPGAEYKLEGEEILVGGGADFDIEFYKDTVSEENFIDGHYGAGSVQEGTVPSDEDVIGIVCLWETDTARERGPVSGEPLPTPATFSYTEEPTSQDRDN